MPDKEYELDPDLFDYDREKFLQVRLTVINAAIIAASVKTQISSIEQPDYTIYQDTDWSNAFLGLKNFYETIDYSPISSAKSSMNKAYEYLASLSEQMGTMVSAICKLDPDIAEFIKDAVLQQDANIIKGYANLGLGGAGIDAVQFYALIEQNLDNPYLNLTDEEKKYLNLVKENADYANMGFWERAKQSVIVFACSCAEGFLQVGEYVLDGGVILTANVEALMNPEYAEEILTRAYADTDVKLAEGAYDAFVDWADLNQYIAYGGIHQVGLGLGKVAGETLIASLPGGAALQTSVKALEAMGKAAGSRNTELDIMDSNALVLANGAYKTATSLVGKQVTSSIKADITADPLGYNPFAAGGKILAYRTGESLGNSILRWYPNSGEVSFGQHLANDSQTIMTEVGGSVIADSIGFNGAFNDATGTKATMGYTILNTAQQAKDMNEKYGDPWGALTGAADVHADDLKMTSEIANIGE